jgi:hypothetical protein
VIIDDIKNIKSDKKDLQKFGITVGFVLGLFGALFLWRGKGVYVYLFIISGIFLLCGLIVPRLLKPIQKVWMTFAVLLGWLMTRVILSILFFLIFTPMGLLARLFGKDFLSLKFNNNTDSYWIPKKGPQKEKRDYENQF